MKTTQTGIRRSCSRGRPAVLIALAMTGLSWAQNNSLLAQQGRAVLPGGPPPWSGPPAPSDGRMPNPAAAQARGALAAERPEPQPNAVLLAASPTAVKKPEPQRIGVNDLVTIIVRESKTATSDGKLEQNKDWSLDTALEKWFACGPYGLQARDFPEGKPAVEFKWKNDYQTDGKYDRVDELTTRVTARIIDVKPNGNLVLEATKEITIDDEGYTIALTGECRSKDVMPDNTILSTQIAEPRIDVQHSGAVRDATRRGWIQRGLDFLRIF